MTGLRLTILIVPYMVPRPMEKTGMVFIAIPVNTSPNVENRELTGGFGALLYPWWPLDVKRLIMRRDIEKSS